MKYFVLIAAIVLSFMVSAQAVSAGGKDKHMICHATGSESNPYNQIEIAPQSVVNAHIDHQHNEDIIPPFTYKGVHYEQNWDAEGQATFANGCVPVVPTPTEVPVTPTPTEVPVTPEPTVATPEPTEAPVTPTPTEVPSTPVPSETPATPTPTEPVTPEPTEEPTPTTPPVTDLPDTGTGTTESTVSLTLLMSVAALLTAGMSLGLRRR